MGMMDTVCMMSNRWMGEEVEKRCRENIWIPIYLIVLCSALLCRAVSCRAGPYRPSEESAIIALGVWSR